MRWCKFSTNKQDMLNTVTAAEVIEKLGLHNLRKNGSFIPLVQSPQFVAAES